MKDCWIPSLVIAVAVIVGSVVSAYSEYHNMWAKAIVAGGIAGVVFLIITVILKKSGRYK